MNWGYRIMVFYLAFVALMVFMVFSAFQYNVNLVAKDYYERELQYQDVIDGKFNLSKSGETVFVNKTASDLDILLPMMEDKALENLEIWLYHKSSQSGDVKINLDKSEDNRFAIPMAANIKGNYVLKIMWYQAERPYYFEKELTI